MFNILEGHPLSKAPLLLYYLLGFIFRVVLKERFHCTVILQCSLYPTCDEASSRHCAVLHHEPSKGRQLQKRRVLVDQHLHPVIDHHLLIALSVALDGLGSASGISHCQSRLQHFLQSSEMLAVCIRHVCVCLAKLQYREPRLWRMGSDTSLANVL